MEQNYQRTNSKIVSFKIRAKAQKEGIRQLTSMTRRDKHPTSGWTNGKYLGIPFIPFGNNVNSVIYPITAGVILVGGVTYALVTLDHLQLVCDQFSPRKVYSEATCLRPKQSLWTFEVAIVTDMVNHFGRKEITSAVTPTSLRPLRTILRPFATMWR